MTAALASLVHDVKACAYDENVFLINNIYTKKKGGLEGATAFVNTL